MPALRQEKIRKLLQRGFIGRPLPGDDQVQQLVRGGPAPGTEFLVMGGDVDVGIAAGEGEGEPLLHLALPASFPVPRMHCLRHVVGHPVAALAQQQRLGRADLLTKLAARRLDGRLALVDAALRHLPGVGLVQPLADEHAPAGPDQHQSDIRPIELRGDVELHGLSCAGCWRRRTMQASRHSKWPMTGTSDTALWWASRWCQATIASIAALSGCSTPKSCRAAFSLARSLAQSTSRSRLLSTLPWPASL